MRPHTERAYIVANAWCVNSSPAPISCASSRLARPLPRAPLLEQQLSSGTAKHARINVHGAPPNMQLQACLCCTRCIRMMRMEPLYPVALRCALGRTLGSPGLRAAGTQGPVEEHQQRLGLRGSQLGLTLAETKAASPTLHWIALVLRRRLYCQRPQPKGCAPHCPSPLQTGWRTAFKLKAGDAPAYRQAWQETAASQWSALHNPTRRHLSKAGYLSIATLPATNQ